MKTMKKVISALLLVCMLMSLCAVGAYAEGDVTLTISITAGASTEQVSGSATLTGADISEYDVTWYFKKNGTDSTFAATLLTWAVGELAQGDEVYAVATKKAGGEGAITSNKVKIAYTDKISGITVTPATETLTKTGSVSLAATIAPETAAAGKAITWTANPDNLVDITAEGVVTVKSEATITDGTTVSITATADGVTSNAAVITLSNPPAPAEPIVTYESVAISYNNAGVFTAVPAFDGTHDESKITYSWTYDSVDNVVASGNGTKYLTLTNNNTEPKNVKVKVTVAYDGTSHDAEGTYTLPAKSTAKTMTLSVSPVPVYAGNSYTLSALDGGTAITGKTVTYEIVSDETNGAKVSGSTLTTGAHGGKVVVTASCDGYTLASDLTIEVADGITLKATPDTLTIGSSANTSRLTAYYNGKTEAISGVTWKQVSTSGANVATLDASTGVVTAGSAAGTVKYHAVIGEQEITSADVTVTVRANNIIEFDVAGFYNSVSSFTVTAKGGVLQLVASNARLKSSPSTQIPGTFNFNWVPATGDPSNGIEVTNLGSGKATAYGRYNGSYSLAVTFTPNDTATYPVTTQNHTVIVNYTPSIIKGNYGVWDGTNGLDFLVNDHISNWSGQVWVDGNLLSDANYVCRGSSDGQIWVTLTPAFISWLRQYYNGNGIHTITVGVDGRNAATGYFKTWGTASSFNGVKTGDDANLGLWAALLGVSAVGAAAAVVIYKRKKANG